MCVYSTHPAFHSPTVAPNHPKWQMTYPLNIPATRSSCKLLGLCIYYDLPITVHQQNRLTNGNLEKVMLGSSKLEGIYRVLLNFWRNHYPVVWRLEYPGSNQPAYSYWNITICIFFTAQCACYFSFGFPE